MVLSDVINQSRSQKMLKQIACLNFRHSSLHHLSGHRKRIVTVLRASQEQIQARRNFLLMLMTKTSCTKHMLQQVEHFLMMYYTCQIEWMIHQVVELGFLRQQ